MLLHRSFVVAACATILSSGMASGQGSAGGSGQGGQAVGVGAPAEQVDGRPPAGRIGGGPPSFNAAPLTSGGVTDSNSGVGNPPGGINSGLADTKPSPPVSGQAQTPVIPPEVRGVAEQAPVDWQGQRKTAFLPRP